MNFSSDRSGEETERNSGITSQRLDFINDVLCVNLLTPSWRIKHMFVLGFSVDGGDDSSGGRGRGLLLGLLSQVLADIRGRVGAFQFRLLPLSVTVGVWLSGSWWFLFGCRWCGGWGLRNGDLRRVQVDSVGRGVVVSVGPCHCVQELVQMRRNNSHA